jgi:hypothetical protein
MSRKYRWITLGISIAILLPLVLSIALPATSAPKAPAGTPTFPGTPANAFSERLVAGTAIEKKLGPFPAGTGYAISAVTFLNSGSSPITAKLRGAYHSGGSGCEPSGTTSFNDGPKAIVPANNSVHLSFPQPFVIDPSTSPHDRSCLDALGVVEAIVVGYRIPA